MSEVIGIVNAKGGTGKSTTAINLGAYLAAKGKKVLLVDLDPQANATQGLGINFDKDHYHIYQCLIADIEPGALIKKTSIFGFDILPSSESLAGANVELVEAEKREFRLKEVLNKIKENYNFILIDSPPTLSLLTINVLVASNYILIPVQAEFYALNSLKNLLSIIDLIREYLNPDLKILGVLITMYDKRNHLSRLVLKEVQRNFPYYVFKAIIPRQITFAESPSFGKTILQYDPDSRGARAYRELTEEIINLLSKN